VVFDEVNEGLPLINLDHHDLSTRFLQTLRELPLSPCALCLAFLALRALLCALYSFGGAFTMFSSAEMSAGSSLSYWLLSLLSSLWSWIEAIQT
jgi:hypothetical protein